MTVHSTGIFTTEHFSVCFRHKGTEWKLRAVVENGKLPASLSPHPLGTHGDYASAFTNKQQARHLAQARKIIRQELTTRRETMLFLADLYKQMKKAGGRSSFGDTLYVVWAEQEGKQITVGHKLRAAYALFRRYINPNH